MTITCEDLMRMAAVLREGAEAIRKTGDPALVEIADWVDEAAMWGEVGAENLFLSGGASDDRNT